MGASRFFRLIHLGDFQCCGEPMLHRACRRSAYPARVLFYGNELVSLFTLQKLFRLREERHIEALGVVCPPANTQTRQPSDVRSFAEAHRLPLYSPPDRTSLKGWEPPTGFDVAVVVSFRYFLADRILRATPATINMHPSLLPLYRGPSPILHTLAAGDLEAGVSVVSIEPAEPMDSGDVLMQRSISAVPGDSLYTRLSRAGAEAVGDVLADFSDRFRRRVPQATVAAAVSVLTGGVDGCGDGSFTPDGAMGGVSVGELLVPFMGAGASAGGSDGGAGGESVSGRDDTWGFGDSGAHVEGGDEVLLQRLRSSASWPRQPLEGDAAAWVEGLKAGLAEATSTTPGSEPSDGCRERVHGGGAGRNDGNGLWSSRDELKRAARRCNDWLRGGRSLHWQPWQSKTCESRLTPGYAGGLIVHPYTPSPSSPASSSHHQGPPSGSSSMVGAGGGPTVGSSSTSAVGKDSNALNTVAPSPSSSSASPFSHSHATSSSAGGAAAPSSPSAAPSAPNASLTSHSTTTSTSSPPSGASSASSPSSLGSSVGSAAAGAGGAPPTFPSALTSTIRKPMKRRISQALIPVPAHTLPVASRDGPLSGLVRCPYDVTRLSSALSYGHPSYAFPPGVLEKVAAMCEGAEEMSSSTAAADPLTSSTPAPKPIFFNDFASLSELCMDPVVLPTLRVAVHPLLHQTSSASAVWDSHRFPSPPHSFASHSSPPDTPPASTAPSSSASSHSSSPSSPTASTDVDDDGSRPAFTLSSTVGAICSFLARRISTSAIVRAHLVGCSLVTDVPRSELRAAVPDLPRVRRGRLEVGLDGSAVQLGKGVAKVRVGDGQGENATAATESSPTSPDGSPTPSAGTSASSSKSKKDRVPPLHVTVLPHVADGYVATALGLTTTSSASEAHDSKRKRDAHDGNDLQSRRSSTDGTSHLSRSGSGDGSPLPLPSPFCPTAEPPCFSAVPKAVRVRDLATALHAADAASWSHLSSENSVESTRSAACSFSSTAAAQGGGSVGADDVAGSAAGVDAAHTGSPGSTSGPAIPAHLHPVMVPRGSVYVPRNSSCGVFFVYVGEGCTAAAHPRETVDWRRETAERGENASNPDPSGGAACAVSRACTCPDAISAEADGIRGWLAVRALRFAWGTKGKDVNAAGLTNVSPYLSRGVLTLRALPLCDDE